MAASAQLEQRVEVLEGQISASRGRQEMFAGNLTEVRHTVNEIKATVDKLEQGQRDTQTWQNITDERLKRMGKDIHDLKSGFAKLNSEYESLSTNVGDLNTKYERLDNKVDGLDKKVGLLAQDVGGLKAGQIELRDMVATLLARSEGVEKQN